MGAGGAELHEQVSQALGHGDDKKSKIEEGYAREVNETKWLF